jgi:cytochrome c peroxidase
MLQRLLSLCAVVGAGCWTEEPLIHDAFTAEQWAKLQVDYAPPAAPAPCDALPPAAQGRPFDCDGAARFGQQLFFEPKLSGPRITPDPTKPADWYPAAKTSCSMCHATTQANKDAAWYTDIRASNAVSQGALNPTPHNTMSLVNVAVGARQWFGWTGEASTSTGVQPCDSANDVVTKIALPKAMQSDAEIVGRAIREVPAYLTTYQQVFGVNAPTDDASMQQNIELALGAYMRRLISLDAPFDDFIRGKPDALDDSATRGFALFVGRAMCAECHRGSMFSDDDFHVTGVMDAGFDKGRGGTGAFYTPRLRNIEKTAPYMHKGTLATLGDVIEFYRWGGSAAGYTGSRDPLMAAFELDDQDGKDLEAFLRALTAAPVSEELRRDTHVVCSGMCP